MNLKMQICELKKKKKNQKFFSTAENITQKACKNKICPSERLRSAYCRCVDILSDAGTGSADLIADDRFSLLFQIFDRIQYFDVESDRKINKSISAGKQIISRSLFVLCSGEIAL